MRRKCDKCGKARKLTRYRKTRFKLCNECYGATSYLDPLTHERCSVCPDKEKKYVATRDRFGNAVCSNCNAKANYHDASRYEQCSVCKSDPKPVAVRTKSGEPICHNCYNKERGYVSKHKLGVCIMCPSLDGEKIIAAFGLCYKHYNQQRRAERRTLSA